MSNELHPLTVKAYGKREITIEEARDDGEVMLGMTSTVQYEQDRYAFLNRDAATQLRDWLTAFLEIVPRGGEQ